MEFAAKAHQKFVFIHPFVEFIADCVVSTQEDLLRLLKNSGGVKMQNGGVNKKLSGGVNLQDKILQETKKKWRTKCAIVGLKAFAFFKVGTALLETAGRTG